jgi:broad specificity phosphatase PhoE
MTKRTTIYLVRHGESESNKQGIISGHSDYDLTEQGKEQVEQTKLELQDVHFDVVYSSDLKRAIHTAEILYGKPVTETNKIHTLRERDFGSLDGKPDRIYKKGNLKRQTMTHEERWTFKPVPNYESDHQLFARFFPALKKIAQDNLGKTILIAAHGSAIRITLMQLTGYTHKELPPGSFSNAAYAELTYDENAGFKVIQISGVKL